MKVAFDASTLNKPWLSGMGVWMVQLYQSMVQAQGLSPDIQIQPVTKLSRWKYKATMVSHLNQSVETWLPFLGNRKFDLYHGPDFKLPESVKLPRVVSIPDIAFYEKGMTSPNFAEKKIQEVEHLLKKQRPEAVIVISQYTKAEVIKRFPEYESKIHVTLLGHEHLLTGESSKASSPEEKPYLLFVGNIEARKNVCRVLQAYDQLCENHPERDEALMLIGRPGFGYDSIESTLNQMKHRDRVKIKGYVENQQLIAYYQNARAFIYPSLIEGFGIPLLEAMVNECPIITANVTATAEVSRDAAIQVDPLSVDAIEDAMNQILGNETLAKSLVERGRSLVKEYSWKRCAEETLQVYKKTGMS